MPLAYPWGIQVECTDLCARIQVPLEFAGDHLKVHYVDFLTFESAGGLRGGCGTISLCTSVHKVTKIEPETVSLSVSVLLN